MKKILIFLCFLIFTAYTLCFPQQAVSSAAGGLVLWYERVLPSLLPFAILSNLLIDSNYLSYLTRFIYPVTRIFLPGSENGAFVLLSGFLFGFPMGSRNCARLLQSGKISQEEADVLFVITNNISPVFVSSFILYQELKLPSMTLPSYLALYLPPLLLGSLLLSGQRRKLLQTGDVRTQKTPTSKSQMNFKIIDAGIMNGFETLTRLGGYIMLFSMSASMLELLPLPGTTKALLTGITEVTNGVHRIAGLPLSGRMRYVLTISVTAFGGLSGIAQTSSMVKGTRLSMKRYFLLKLALTAGSALLAWIVF